MKATTSRNIQRKPVTAGEESNSGMLVFVTSDDTDSNFRVYTVKAGSIRCDESTRSKRYRNGDLEIETAKGTFINPADGSELMWASLPLKRVTDDYTFSDEPGSTLLTYKKK